jgi:TonB family protein
MGTAVAAASIALALVSALAQQSAGPGGGIQDVLRTPRKFVDLTYPPEALAARVSGFVVLELAVDDQGRVASAQVLTGAPLLAGPAAANAREWTFEPQAGRIVLVYRFDIDHGLCNADTRSLFRLRSRTLATITACTGPDRPLTTLWETDDLHVVDMPHVEYPPIAQSARVRGTVVVRLVIAANGAVTSATPLAGAPLLTEAAFNNARAWKFAATRERETIVVYEFTFMDRLRTDPPCTVTTLNEIVYPRYIRISASASCIHASAGLLGFRASRSQLGLVSGGEK